jgi:hypothetical protein
MGRGGGAGSPRATLQPSISRDYTVDDLQGDRLRAIRYEDI